MKIIVAGCGKVGEAILEFLSREEHDITLIDSQVGVVERLVSQYDAIGVVGNSASCEILKEASVDDVDVLIAVTESDELNIMTCMIAKKMGAKNVIARVRNPEYTNQVSFMRNQFGLDMVFNPEQEAAREIRRILQFPSAMQMESFTKGRVNMAEFRIPQDSMLVGKKLYELSHVCKAKVVICVVQRNGEVFIPSGDFELQAGDRVNVTAEHEQLYLFFKELGILSKKIRSVILIGGGRISFYLAQMLEKLNIQVKIIERDQARCRELSGALPKSIVIHADGSDIDVLTEEGISDTDACVALTGIDEENLVVSMLADTCNVRKIIAKVTRRSFEKIIPELGLTCSLISPKYISASHILRYVRGVQNSQGSNVETLHKIVDNQVEALQFVVNRTFTLVGIPLKELKLKSNLLIASIIRNNNILTPDGASTIEAGDRVILVTTNKGLRDLMDIVE